MSFQDLSFNGSQWWTKAMENYNTPPSTESSLDDSPMDLSSETKEPIQEISSSSSPASARWVSSQPVCLRSLLATAQEQLDCSPLAIDEPPLWTPSPSPRPSRFQEPVRFKDPPRIPGPCKIKPSMRDNARKRPGRHSVPVASPYPDIAFFRALKDVPGKADQKSQRTISGSWHQRRALASANIHNVQTIDDFAPSVAHANRSVSMPSLAMSTVPIHSPPKSSAMDIDSPPRFQRVSSMPPPPSTSKRTFEPPPEPSFIPSPSQPSTPRLHPLLIEQKQRKEQRLREKETKVVTASSSSKPVKPVIETKLSRSTTIQGPPVLGMRRGHTTYNGLGSRPLPTKQQGFKPPLLRKSQNPIQVKQEKSLSAPTAIVHPNTPAPPLKHRPKSMQTEPARRKELSSPGSDCNEADSSFGDLSLDIDLDALEGVMREYD